MSEAYSVTLLSSSKELSAREKIRYKNFSAAIAIDSLVSDESEVASITPVAYASFAVHNDKAEHTDYTLYIIEDAAGNLFKTGSEAFFSRFVEIFDTMAEDAPGEEYSISVIKRPSTKYKGKYILLCRLD